MKTYLDSTRGTAHCKGCGHPHVLQALDAALQTAGVPEHRIALVTDIGCVGLADAQFPTLHTVHALHGRAAAIAAGLRLAPPCAGEAALKPVVLVGDGGATIGLLHLVHAAQLDVDVTVVVHNNLVYGMTGGQHSGFTPQGFRTNTTPHGCDVQPLDLGQVLGGAGCGYFARARAPSDELEGFIAAGLRRPGFACIEALELCPTFAARVGGMTGKGLQAMAADGGLAMGVVHDRPARRRAHGPDGATAAPDRSRDGAIQPQRAWSHLEHTARVVLAGRAGERVQSAARFAAAAAAAAGLHVTLRTDNPVTQGRGYSVAELTVAPERILWTGHGRPDLAIATAPEGLQQLESRGLLGATGHAKRLILDESLEVPVGTPSESAPLRRVFGAGGCALGALVQAVRAAGWIADEAWGAALALRTGRGRTEAARVLAKSGARAVS